MLLCEPQASVKTSPSAKAQIDGVGCEISPRRTTNLICSVSLCANMAEKDKSPVVYNVDMSADMQVCPRGLHTYRSPNLIARDAIPRSYARCAAIVGHQARAWQLHVSIMVFRAGILLAY